MGISGMRVRLRARIAMLALPFVLLAAGAQAQDKVANFSLQEQPLGQALLAYGAQAGVSVAAPDTLTQGKRGAAVTGARTQRDALIALLNGTGLQFEFIAPNAVRILPREQRSEARPPAPPRAAARADEPPPEELTVTGSRIRGAPIASPVIAQTQKQALDAGQATLADVLRAIPQNFGGGQNPNVGFAVSGGGSINLASASSVNLRGLGSDATLTLLNGHRLSYNGARQAVDVSMVPLAALDRVEVVADGASALYGSDAIAGVANIILKRDFDGVATTARMGVSTDGGNFQQQYAVVGGSTWGTGGVIATFDFERDREISSRDRDYARSRASDLSLLPEMQHNTALLSGHQDITDRLSVEFDALYNKRWSDARYPLANLPDVRANGITYHSEDESWVLAPTVKLALPGDWRLSASGTVTQDLARFYQSQWLNGQLTSIGAGCYCNTGASAELNADGTLFRLPGGDMKLAAGAGWRSNTLKRIQSGVNVDVTQDAYFGYGELNIPVVGAAQLVPFVHQLNFSAAVRYEDYPGVDRVATPKLGLIYAPTPDLDVKASWGKSFKIPTLNQQYAVRQIVLFPTSTFGSGPSNVGSLYIVGGNPGLKPERATTWSATVAVHPQAVPGLRVELSYYNVDFTDRVVTPITPLGASLSPIFAGYVTRNPTKAQQDAAIASVTNFLNAFGPYDPSNIYALINNQNVNAAVQSLNGVDMQVSYTADLPGASALTLSGYASYLHSTQQVTAGQAVQQLAGTFYNPPHWRGRAGAVWERGPLTLSGFVNYIGGESDQRTAARVDVASMTTFDMTGRYRFEANWLRDTELLLTVQNLFDKRPPFSSPSIAYDTPFDSTNYSPVGRFVGLMISRKW